MSGNTPLPWLAKGADILANGTTDTYSGAVLGPIAFALPLSERDGEGRTWSAPGSSEANAALIVRAVNSHDELRAALEVANTALAKAYNYAALAEHAGAYSDAITTIRAALNRSSGNGGGLDEG